MRELVRSSDAMMDAGEALAQKLSAGTTILLTGNLGAGKTQFTKGIARGLGITDEIVSPTFNIVVTYEDGHIPLAHFDLYRLEDSCQLEDIDFYAFTDEASPYVCVIEWPDKFMDEMPEGAIKVAIEKLDDTTRIVQIVEV